MVGNHLADIPAIKKSEVGIALGCRSSDVVRDAADIILLNDDLSSVIYGGEEGRLVFENLKKSIAYSLSSGLPEIAPFLFYVVFQVPLPLTAALVLCIDLVTDIVPTISFAYENPEFDLMTRRSRNMKTEKLINAKLISFSYLQIGVMQTSAAFFTYFVVMNDYGFKPHSLFYLVLKQGILPNTGDVYDHSLQNFGNTNANGDKMVLDWSDSQNNQIDLRLFYHEHRGSDAWSQCRWSSTDAEHYWKSPHSGYEICYTSEALRYA